MNVFILSNGVEVELSTRKDNRSGYTGAILSVAWTLDPERPFIACCGNPSDPEVHAQLHAREGTSWHGGHYADAREAAYVTAIFKLDPVNVDYWIHENGNWVDFPSDLYDLPEGLHKADATKILTAKRKSSVKKNPGNLVHKGKLPFYVAFPNRTVNDNKGVWPKIYEAFNGKELFTKYGEETVLRAKQFLTPQEFVNLFDLDKA